MTSRARHLEEMRYALAHNLSLAEARKRIVADKRRASERAVENLRNQPLVPARLRGNRCGSATPAAPTGSGQSEARKPNPILNGDAPWMMRD